ncbi:MAG TPA: hypothetical protein VF272_04285 [Candidatus Saccharimonadia bacterium]
MNKRLLLIVGIGAAIVAVVVVLIIVFYPRQEDYAPNSFNPNTEEERGNPTGELGLLVVGEEKIADVVLPEQYVAVKAALEKLRDTKLSDVKKFEVQGDVVVENNGVLKLTIVADGQAPFDISIDRSIYNQIKLAAPSHSYVSIEPVQY